MVPALPNKYAVSQMSCRFAEVEPLWGPQGLMSSFHVVYKSSPTQQTVSHVGYFHLNLEIIGFKKFGYVGR